MSRRSATVPAGSARPPVAIPTKRCRSLSSGRPTMGRLDRRRSSSRAALVETRYAQVVNLACPANRGSPLTMAMSASWVASCPSASLLAKRRQVAYIWL